MIDFVKNTISMSGSRILIIFINFITSIIIARMLGPYVKGEYTVVLIFVFIIVALINIGINNSTVYFISKGDFPVEEIFSTNLILSIIIGITGMLIGIIPIVFLKDIFFKDSRIFFLFLALPLIPLNTVLYYLLPILFGMGKIRQFNFINISYFLISLLLITISLFIFKLNLTGVILSEIISISCVCITLFIIITGSIGRIVYRINMKYLKSTLSYGIKMYFANLMISIYERLDMLLLNWLLAPSAIGYYSVASAMTQNIITITQPISGLLFKKVAGEKNREKANEYTPLVVRTTLIIIISFGLFVFFLSDYIVLFFYSDLYLNSIYPLKILLLAIILYTIWGLLSNDLAARGRPMLITYTLGFSLIINFIINIYVIPLFGINGASWSKVVSNFIAFFMILTVYIYFTKNKWHKILIIQKDDLILYKNIFHQIVSRFSIMIKRNN